MSTRLVSPGRLDPRIAVPVVFVAAMFMSIMDSTIVNVALPSLGRQFNVPADALDSVVVAYLISLAVSTPASGWVADAWGSKRTFLLALALFGASSALCGLAGSITSLVGFRFLQGLAGGMLTPVGQAMLYRTFPPAERIQVSRILILPTVIAPAAGPAIGGWLVTNESWRWVFFVNVPIAIAALLFGLLTLAEGREHDVGPFDGRGFLLSAVGFALITFALTAGPSRGWLDTGTLASGLAGIAALAALVVVELRAPHPMLDLRLLGNRLFRATNVTSLFSGAGFLGLLFLAPLFLQDGRGVSALTSGLTTFPEAIGVAFSSQIVARLYPRIGPRRLLAAGLAWAATMMALQFLVGEDTSLWVVRGLMFLTGAGMAYGFMSGQTAAFAAISPSEMARASAIYSVQGRLGAALGVALLSAVLGALGTTYRDHGGAVRPNLAAYHVAFLVAAALTFTGAIIALTIRDQDAASTLARHDDQLPIEPMGGG